MTRLKVLSLSNWGSLFSCEFIIENTSQELEVLCKKGVLRNFAKFIGKHQCQSLFFNKVAVHRPLAQMFSCEFCKNSKNTFSYRTPLVAASKDIGTQDYLLDFWILLEKLLFYCPEFMEFFELSKNCLEKLFEKIPWLVRFKYSIGGQPCVIFL